MPGLCHVPSWRKALLAVGVASVLVLLLAGGRSGVPGSGVQPGSPEEGENLPWFEANSTRYARAQRALAELTPEDLEPVALAIATPAGYSASNAGATLVFAHVADGRFQFGSSQRFMQTTFNLVNDSDQPVTGTLSFFKAGAQAGSPGVAMRLTVDGASNSQFPVQIPARSTRRLTTSGTGSLQAGWAEFRSDQAVTGASGFSTRDSGGRIYSDVGVSESPLAKHFTFFADSMGGANTGVALVNPSANRQIAVSVELRRANGTRVTGHSRLLPPRHHVALFLNELFPGVAGIGAFEGSVVLQSEDAFAGVTLRTVGAQLTSVPMVTLPDPRETRSRLVFPQVADGLNQGIRIVTAVVLFNNTARRITGALNFIGSDGQPMTVSIGSRTAADFNFDLAPGAVTRLVTRGTGSVKLGWAEVNMDGPASGAALYRILSDQGAPISEVGVPSALLPAQANLIADSPGDYRTGLALANRSTSEEEVTLELYDSAGTRRRTVTVELGPRGHKAGFLDEEGFFKGIAGIETWQGRVAVRASEGTVAVMTLRQAGLLTTSVPTVSPVRPFVPVAVLTPAQTLTSSSPALRLQYGQVQGELAMDQLEVSIPTFGLNSGSLKVGDELAYGTFLLNSGSRSEGGIAKLICTGTSPPTFDLAVSMHDLLDYQGSIVLMPGRLEGGATSGFKWILGPVGAPALDWNESAGLELDLTLRDGLARSPAAAGTVQVTSRILSTSTKREGEAVRVERTAGHSLALQAKQAGVPSVETSRPLFMTPGNRLRLLGGSFGAQPRVRYTGPEGTLQDLFPQTLSATELESFAPGDAIPGNVAAVNGAAVGNSLAVQSLFAPVTRVQASRTPTSGPFTLSLQWDQAARQLGVAGFRVGVYGVSWPSLAGGTGAEVGKLTFSGGSRSSDLEEFRLVLQLIAPGRTVLQVLDGDDDEAGSLEILRTDTDNGPGGVAIVYAPAEVQELPTVHGHPFGISMELTGVTFPALAAGTTASWNVEGTSLPSALYGAGSGLRSSQSVRRLQ